ncbi:MAG: hypothetical protein QXF88_02690 [Candidatus Aenigmatarchaeota archaeon]
MSEAYRCVVQTQNTIYGVTDDGKVDVLNKGYAGELVGFTSAQKGTVDWVKACYAKIGELDNEPENGMRMVINSSGDANIITTPILEIYVPKSSE